MKIKEAFEIITTFDCVDNKLTHIDLKKYEEACDVVEEALGLRK